jgi:hypothetical protein
MVTGWKKIDQANDPPKQVRVAILISDKVDFKPTLVKRDKAHFILRKGEIHQKKSIINLYATNVSVPNFIKHILNYIKAHIGYNSVVVGDVNTPVSPTDRSSKKKSVKKS